MSTRVIDEAAKVFADPQAYADEAKLHAALTHLRANAPVSWVDVPDYRPFWAITKHADVMEIERANTVFTNSPRPVLVTIGGRRATGRHRCQHPDPHGRSAASRGAGDRRRLVPPESHASAQAADRRAREALRRPHVGGRPGMRLRSGSRGELSAVRDHVDARHARIRLPSHAEVHAGTVRQRRRRVSARHHESGADGRAPGDVPVLQRTDCRAAGEPDRGPGVGDRQRHDRRRAVVRHRHGVVLPHHRHRRSRHDQCDDCRWPARADREPRPARAARAPTRI